MATFEEVLPHLKAGKKIYRESENDLQYVIGQTDTTPKLVCYDPQSVMNAFQVQMSLDELLATDWEVGS